MPISILVTGASGELGKCITEHLLSQIETKGGDYKIIAGTRDPSKLSTLQSKGVEVRKIDFDDVSSLEIGFKGVDRLIFISTGVRGEPGSRLQQHIRAVKAAESAKIQHISYTSLFNCGLMSPHVAAPDHRGTEDAIVETGIPCAILRNNIYCEVIFMLRSQYVQGKTFSSAGKGKVSYITRSDCARAAASASLRAIVGYFDITGPEAFDVEEVTQMVATKSGKNIEVIHVSDEQIVKGAKESGISDDLAEVVSKIGKARRMNMHSGVSNGYEFVTGLKPTSMEQFLSDPRTLAAIFE